jgi:hypothetical protein
MNDWQETQDVDGKVVATLAGTRVLVSAAPEGAHHPWCWEVRFADGQVQVGHEDDPDAALAHGKKVAERFLP